MDNDMVVFEGIDIPVLEAEGRIWFRSTEVGRILEFSNAFKMVQTHCHEHQYKEWKVGMGRPAVYATEAGLYRLIMRSKAIVAVRFQDWVTDEVLPQIRQKGFYATDEAKEKLRKMCRSLVAHQRLAQLQTPMDVEDRGRGRKLPRNAKNFQALDDIGRSAFTAVMEFAEMLDMQDDPEVQALKADRTEFAVQVGWLDPDHDKPLHVKGWGC
jgi:prophage antirepressor-like protein